MKQPFRFFRGEFKSGYWLYAMLLAFNTAVSDILDELVYWANVQYKSASEVTDGQVPMRDADIIGLAKFAGVFPFFFAGGTWPGMFFFSDSHIVAGSQRSERGLYLQATELFEYIRTENDDYPDDISTQATPAARMSIIPHGAPILGYVRADAELYNEDGTVNYANVLPTPPVGVAYDPFYGEQYLTLSSDANVIAKISTDMTKLLTEIMQQIRYNGPSITEFLSLTNALLELSVIDITFTFNVDHYVVNYTVDEDYQIDNRGSRLKIWQTVTTMKFKLFELVENL